MLSKIYNHNFEGAEKVYNDKTLEKIRAGNRFLTEEFINTHEQFICKVISDVTGKTVIEKTSEEYKVGLSAFIYSIHKFDKKIFYDFLTFSEQILKEWVKEYLNQDREAIREEIALLKHKLWEFGVTLEDLVSESPKDKSSVKSSLYLAKRIINNEPAFEGLNLLRNLSEKESAEINKFFAKKIKRNKKYIIALILILKSNLEILKRYLANAESENYIIDKTGTVLECSRGISVFMTEQGRFAVLTGVNDYYIGQRIYFNNYKSLKGKIARYSVLAASVSLTVILAFTAINYIQSDMLKKDGNDTRQVITDIDKGNTKKISENSPAEGNKETSKPATDKPALLVEKLATPEPGKPYEQNKAVDKAAFRPNPTNKPALKTEYTSTPKNISTPASKEKPTVTPGKLLPDQKPTRISVPTNIPVPTRMPVPTGYATVKATGVPATLHLISDLTEVSVGQNYTISMYLNRGNNATMWVLYEDGKALFTLHYPDNSPNEQFIRRLITAKIPGTYTYKCEASNSFGSVSSSEISVVVK